MKRITAPLVINLLAGAVSLVITTHFHPVVSRVSAILIHLLGGRL